MDIINDAQGDVKINLLTDNKIDGALFILSEGLPKFIPDDMSFVREDSCAENVFRFHRIPQYHIKNRLKGHNYHHELKRTNTEATREDNIFKTYADKSVNAMNKFLRELHENI